MATSSYFNNFKRTSEQDLVESLIIESIKIFGHDIVYLPRQHEKVDQIWGEDVLSHFDKSYELEAYIKTNGYEGASDIFTKFGVEIQDSATLTMSIRRFRKETDMQRPNEGDLIYFPVNNALFEIKFVEDKSIFFQLGNLYAYDVKIERFMYSNEKLDTGYDPIDAFETTFSTTVTLDLGSGSGTYVAGEQAFQGPFLANATAQGEVISFDSTAKQLVLINVKGIFASADGNVIGSTSAAIYTLATVDEYTQPTRNLADNRKLEDEAAGFVDFSETNPFGDKV